MRSEAARDRIKVVALIYIYMMCNKSAAMADDPSTLCPLVVACYVVYGGD